ncbi:translocation protein TolB [Anaerohalosphaera lusitana]|uniref:Translocation protein TolB n=1 Tax=Anaerohalosphaera lusitana TaxID=1936003 RepID=A0A1U9NGS3_9BACT|nr:hypothetical protein [Anaerohalosphaera lusitana]AQT67133.1 translocation protein TolB [Anaerohalosphaera lusitana]
MAGRSKTGLAWAVMAGFPVLVWIAFFSEPADAQNGGGGEAPLEQMKCLEAAIRDLEETFGEDYAGEDFLERLNELQDRFDEAEYKSLKREALRANPLVSGQPILYVVRSQYLPDHHNTATIFQSNEINAASFRGGGALKTVDLKTGKVETLVEQPDGLVRDPEVSYSGDKIVFSMRKGPGDDYSLYEIGSDGESLRALTGAEKVSDIDPFYLPDGRIGFSSTREPKYCMCNRHIMANLFVMDADGANIHQIGKSTLFEGHGSVMADGRILYDRWEYVDRNFGDAQGLWTVNPDGTSHEVYFGNNTGSPGGVIDARAIPGTDLVLCILGSCHDRPWGVMAMLDRNRSVDGREAVLRTWPAKAAGMVDEKANNAWDKMLWLKPKYEDPYPLSEKYFLCSRMTGEGEKMGIYLVDVFGNELLLHAEGAGCFDPMPVGPRETPAVITRRRDFSSESGKFYVMDVYEGTHMEGVQRGEVKYLRVVESPEKRYWTHTSWGGQGIQCPAVNWHSFETKRILGTVPVEEDGSAYFEVPADTFVYFQLLDEDKRMIQSMRSGTMIQPGETVGCTGCHENRLAAPPVVNKTPEAVRRKADSMSGWYGSPRKFSFMKEVQPVLSKNCVSCHDYDEKAGGKLNLAGDRTNTFNTSYNELWRKGYIKAIGAGPAQIQPAKSWGARVSRLMEVLEAGHGEVELTEEEMDRIETWIDINAVYYPVYSCAYPDNVAGRSPLDTDQIKRLGELTGVDFNSHASFRGNKGPLISFDRPGKSLCLEMIDDEGKRREALAIIEAGKAKLEQRPRADMDGYVPCEKDLRRQEFYEKREEIERANRKAIREKAKKYDSDFTE